MKQRRFSCIRRNAYTRNLIEAVPSRLKPRVSVKKESNTTVLTVKDLSVYYEDRSNSIFKKKEKQYAVEHVSFDVYEGESLGLVGESGLRKDVAFQGNPWNAGAYVGRGKLSCQPPTDDFSGSVQQPESIQNDRVAIDGTAQGSRYSG